MGDVGFVGRCIPFQRFLPALHACKWPPSAVPAANASYPGMFAVGRAVPSLRTCMLSSGASRRPSKAPLAASAMVTEHSKLHPDVQEVLLTKEAIAARVGEVGRCVASCSPVQALDNQAPRACPARAQHPWKI